VVRYLKALVEAKGFITLGSPSYEDTILFMEDKIGNHNVISDFDYKEIKPEGFLICDDYSC